MRITTHAIDRYLERLTCIGREAAQRALQSAVARSEYLCTTPNGADLRVAGNVCLVVRGATVVTVLEEAERRRVVELRVGPGTRAGKAWAELCARLAREEDEVQRAARRATVEAEHQRNRAARSARRALHVAAERGAQKRRRARRLQQELEARYAAAAEG